MIFVNPSPSLCLLYASESLMRCGKTNQSSTKGDGTSDKAIDGNTNPTYVNGFCTHTMSTGDD